MHQRTHNHAVRSSASSRAARTPVRVAVGFPENVPSLRIRGKPCHLGVIRSGSDRFPGSPRPWPRHLTGGHERPRRRARRDGRGRTGLRPASLAEPVMAGQAGSGSFWTLQAEGPSWLESWWMSTHPAAADCGCCGDNGTDWRGYFSSGGAS
jgi:hypothetical protein